MENLNQALYLWLNAPAHPNAVLLAMAQLFAEQLIWLVPLLIGLGWLRGTEPTRKTMLLATCAGLAGLLLNQLIGMCWQHPRPFMVGLGHTFIAHVADSSFPSDHLTLWWSVTLSLALQRWAGRASVVLVVLGLPMAWARIYLGVHYPFDMLGAALVAGLSVALSRAAARWYLPAVFRAAGAVHRVLFARLINRGWVRQ